MESELLHQGSCVSAPATHSSSEKNQTKTLTWAGPGHAEACRSLEPRLSPPEEPPSPSSRQYFPFHFTDQEIESILSTQPQTIDQRSTNSSQITTPCSRGWKFIDVKVLKELKKKFKRQNNNSTHPRFKVRASSKTVA